MSQLPPGFVIDGEPQAAPARRGFIPGQPDPYKAEDQQFQREAQRRADEAARRAAAADARSAEAHTVAMEKARNPGSGDKPVMVPDGAAKRTEANVGTFTSLESAATGFQDDFGGNPVGGLENWAQQYADIGTPGQREWWSAFRATDNQIRNDLFGSALTAPEKAAYEQTTVSPGMRPEIIRQNVTRRAEIVKGALERQRKFMLANGYKPEAVDALFAPIVEKQQALAATAGGEDQEAAAAAAPTGTPPANPGMVNPPAGSETPPGLAPATGGQRLVEDPQTAAQLDAMLRAGAPYSEINAFAVSRGNAPVSPRQYAEVRAFLKKNPNYKGSMVNAMKAEEMDGYDQFITNVVGSDPTGVAGYTIGAGQFLSGNTLDNMAGDPNRARQSMDVMRAESPTATTLGEISGGIMAGLTGEAGLARLGMASGIGRGLVADTAMGAANGAGMADNGSRLGGAGQGGLSALVGSAAGSGAMKVAGRVVSPSGGSLADLYSQGIRPTPGQRFGNANDGKGIAGMAGRAINATEEALQSVPIVGSAIRGAREESRDQFQVGAFNQALSEIGETLPKGMGPGTDPHKFAQEAFNRVYDRARSGMKMVADEELANDLGQLAPDISTLGPQAQNKLKAILANSVNSKISNGELSGNAYKGAVSDLGKHIARLRKGMTADDQTAADILEGVQGSLDSAARRHSDPAAVELLDAADAGYAKLVRIEGAAARRGGDAGTFSPAGFDSEVQKATGGVRSKAYLRGDAQMQDYAKQGRSLEDRMPNSGTPERMAFGTAAAGGAAYLEPTSLGILGAIATAYAPGVRKVVKGAMAPGGPRSKAISAQLKKRARLVGAAGAASAVAALPGTAPSQ